MTSYERQAIHAQDSNKPIYGEFQDDNGLLCVFRIIELVGEYLLVFDNGYVQPIHESYLLSIAICCIAD
jgi:hypothetical protein